VASSGLAVKIEKEDKKGSIKDCYKSYFKLTDDL
jgi:hypothetical protein